MGSPTKIAKARLHDFWSRFLLFYPKEKERDGKGGLGGLPKKKGAEKTHLKIIDGWEANSGVFQSQPEVVASTFSLKPISQWANLQCGYCL
jgi:hypothetical protein